MELWLVGEFKDANDNLVRWEYVGIFDSEEKALAACHTDLHCIALVQLNAEVPAETHDFPRCWYPQREARPW